jgi:DnaJ family protein C protein 28
MNNKTDKKRNDADARAEHFMRMRFEWNDLIEELIQEGQERGAFADLKGKGKPLNLEQNPYGAEWELAHKLMKENDVLPPWIAQRNEILTQIDQFRIDVVRDWTRHEQAFRLAQGQGQKSALSLSWDDSCRQWEIDIKKLNKRIADFNLGRPSEGLEMVKLRLDKELERAGAARTLN